MKAKKSKFLLYTTSENLIAYFISTVRTTLNKLTHMVHCKIYDFSAYPMLKEVKKIKMTPPKPGHLYPSLSDMEAESSEAPDCELESNTSIGHINR